MVKPVVVIATHERVGITCRVIDSLLNQTLVPEIVVIVSHRTEAVTFRSHYPQVHTVQHINAPLGDKWQSGVNQARKMGADPLIICGSDDFLEKKHVARCCLYMQRDYDFVGLKSWYIYDTKTLYHFDYLARLPLGGGRAYAAKFLNLINWKLFVSKDKHLDDRGYDLVNYHKAKKKLLNDPYILSVKGDWPVMNKAESFFNSPNARLIKRDLKLSIMENFNYVP